MAEKIEFHFKGGSAEQQRLPVEYMINLLSNVKDLAYLMIAQHKGITFNERFRPSKEIKERCFINCEVPTEGSYNQALLIDYSVDSSFPAFNVKESLDNFFISSANNDENEIQKVFPNPKMRAKALSHVRLALPSSDDDIYVEINNTSKLNSKFIQKNITTLIDKTKVVVEEYMTVVTGRLSSINFDEKKIVIVYPVTNKELDCFYDENIEDMLINNRRELIQVIGKVVFDDNEQPKKITDVIDVQEIELSPIEVEYIKYNGKRLHFRNMLKLNPVLDDTEQFYILSCPEIGLEIFTYTRQEMVSDLNSGIICLWEEYAKAEDNELTSDAIQLKQRLLSLIEEIDNGN